MRASVTTGEAAWMTGLSQSTILRAAYAGQVKAFRTPGGHYRLNRDSVLSLVSPAKRAVWTKTRSR